MISSACTRTDINAAVTSKTIVPHMSWIDYAEDVFTNAGPTGNPAYFYTQDTGVSERNVPSNVSVDAWLDYIFSADAGSS
jgi:hypothetical protein